jgi:hypothetical protein
VDYSVYICEKRRKKPVENVLRRGEEERERMMEEVNPTIYI